MTRDEFNEDLARCKDAVTDVRQAGSDPVEVRNASADAMDRILWLIEAIFAVEPRS